MKNFRKIARWLRNSKGVATSLIEATATVAVGAVLAGVAVGGSIDAINNSKVQAAISDVSTIGEGILAFYQDNGFLPLYVDGQKTGRADEFYGFLVSENGTYPTDSTTGFNGSGLTWELPTSPTPWVAPFFGDKPDYAPGPSGHATIEGQLIRNELAQAVAGIYSGPRYPLRGTYDPQRGWHGPYITTLPKTDPWGDKYLVNVRNLNAGYLDQLPRDAAGKVQNLAVIVISAGADRSIETPVDQKFDSFKVDGDDIVFRIK